MKKLFVVALLAIAGATSAMAGDGGYVHHVRVACEGELVFEKDALIAEDASSEAIERYHKELLDIFCDED